MFKNIFLFRFLILALCLTIPLLQSCKHDDSNTYKMDNQEFIKGVVGSIDFKIAAAELSDIATQNERIKEYSVRMSAEQSETRTAISNLSGFNKSQPTGIAMNDPERKLLESLLLLKDEAFDREFSRLMVQAHQNDIGLFVSASVAGGVRDKDLRDFAVRRLPSLTDQLENAQNLQHQIESM